MHDVLELLRSRGITQIAVPALISFCVAGCSADMSTRFSQNAYSSNPLAFDPQPTGSVQSGLAERPQPAQYTQPQSPYPQSRVYTSQPLPPPVDASQPYSVTNSGTFGGAQGVTSNGQLR